MPRNTFKTRLDTFGNDFGHFWNFEKKNWKIFENSTLHGTLGINFFRKNHPITRLDTFGNTFGQFWNFENIFFENFRRLDIPWKTGQKFFEKFAPKHVQNRFGYFWERFWPFLNFENFLIFKKIFEESTPHGTLGNEIFRKICPKTRSKHAWILSGTILGIFGIL